MKRSRVTRRQVDDDVVDDADQDHIWILSHLEPERYAAVEAAYPDIKDQLHPEAWAHFVFGGKQWGPCERRSRRERDELDRELRR